MKAIEIIFGVAVLVVSLILVIVCMMQEQKPQNATAALTGSTTDSFYEKNQGRTKEARLKRFTFWMAVFFFAAILFMDIVMPFLTK